MAGTQTHETRTVPRLTHDLRRRIREAVRQETDPRKHDMVRSLIGYGGEDELWSMAWSQRHLSLPTFSPGMRAVVRLAREVAGGEA